MFGRTFRYVALLTGVGVTLALPLSAGGAIPVGPFSGDVSQSATSHADVLGVNSPSSCFAPVGSPSVTTDAATRKYLAYSFTNDTGGDVCITINYTDTSGHVFAAAYLGSFSPNNIATNYLASGAHTTDCAGQGGNFGFQVPAGQTFVIVVEECTPGGGGQFSFTIGTQVLGVTAPDTITKQASPSSIAEPGGPITFSLSVPNLNSWPVTVILVDDVYGNLSNPNNGVSQNTCEGQTTIAANATLNCSFVANVTGSAGTQHKDTVTATYSAFGAQASASGSATVTITSSTAATFRAASARRTSRGVVVRWRTGTEAELLGFQVYRSRGHSWQKVTRSLVAARGSVSGASYRFLDRSARRHGISYRYRIKALNRDGTAGWFGPVRVT